MKQKVSLIVGAIARHFLGGYGVAAAAGKAPVIADEDISKLIGAAMTLAAILWSIWRKVQAPPSDTSAPTGGTPLQQ